MIGGLVHNTEGLYTDCLQEAVDCYAGPELNDIADVGLSRVYFFGLGSQ